MLSIGEFARLGTVSVRTLRHYEEIGLLLPAQVNPDTGYRAYTADQLGRLNRIVALKELGLSLTQARQLLDGITLDELRGMLILRRAQLEHELEEHANQLLGVEARLRYIEREGAMPADDIVVKKVPEMGVVAIAEPMPEARTPIVVAAVNRCRPHFDRPEAREHFQGIGPLMVFYEHKLAGESTVYLGLPVARQPAELPEPFAYVVLPEVEAAVTVRSGAAASIYPDVYHDLARWVQAQGYEPDWPARDVWVHEVDDIADISQQVFEVQLPFSRPVNPAE
jgi:DNA-binding transcriptional MerR regulator